MILDGHTAIAVRKTWVLHKPIKNRPTLAYKNIVRKCYEDMFLLQIYILRRGCFQSTKPFSLHFFGSNLRQSTLI